MGRLLIVLVLSSYFCLFLVSSSHALCPSALVEKLLKLPAPAPADSVIGQDSFGSTSLGPTNSSFISPFGVSVSPVSGKLFVSDVGWVLRFPPTSDTQVGGVAEVILGQSGFDAVKVTGCSSSQMNGPGYIFVDQQDSLWVSDHFNNRILRFDNASSISSGSPAQGVLGQPNFTTCSSGLASTSLNLPQGIWVDSDGILWVADQTNRRVLRFNDAREKANGAPADGLLGQNGFNAAATLSDDTALVTPDDVTVDQYGNLYVSDHAEQRVLRFNDAKTKTNRTAADGLFGLMSFVSVGASGTSNMYQTNSPMALAVDGCNNLFVADAGYNRISMFSNILLGTGYPAETLELGQSNFTSFLFPPLSASTMSAPFGQLHYDTTRQRLYFADGGSQRVLVWTTNSTSVEPTTTSTTTTTTTTSTPTATSTSTPTTSSDISKASSLSTSLFVYFSFVCF